MDELRWLDATDQAALVRRGEVQPRELVESALARIERDNPALNAVVIPRAERALDDADRVAVGPFAGVPLLLKDLGCPVAGEPLHAGMRFLADRGWLEPTDAYLAQRFRAAGFVFCGRTNVPELGQLLATEPAVYGPARNPWDPARSTGGSSGGAAAAVAAGLVPIAHGSDGAGSIRNPAACCGLVGLKPSRWRISPGPRPDNLTGGQVEGVLTRAVRDTAAALDAIAGPGAGDAATAPPPARPYQELLAVPPPPLRIGVLRRIPTDLTALHPDCVAAVDRAADLLSGLGHAVVEAHPAVLDDGGFSRAAAPFYMANVARRLDFWSRETGDEIGPDDVEPFTWAFAELGRLATAAQVLAGMERLYAAGRAIAEWYGSGFDLLLLATTATPAPPLGELNPAGGDPLEPGRRTLPSMLLTNFANLTGQPAISLPLHWTAPAGPAPEASNGAGLPVGVQLAAAYGREDLLLQIAGQLEQAAPWSHHHPPKPGIDTQT